MPVKFSTATAAAAVLAATFLAQGAYASTLNITGIAGTWTQTDPGFPDVTGQNTPEIRWGEPVQQGGSQSGYRFDAAGVPINDVEADENFSLGTFTHFNFPIFAPSLSSARLSVDIDFDILDAGNNLIGQRSVTAVFEFDHWETPNNADPCADGGANGVGVNDNGCADRVIATTNAGLSDFFTIGDENFVFDVLGFCRDCGPDPVPFTQFWTREDDANRAVLVARWTSEVNVIPLPAAGWLLLTGLAGLAAMSRRKRA